MTIQIYLDETDDYLSMLQTIHSILEMKNAKLVESAKEHFPSIRVSTRPYKNSITINIALEEFCLLLIFVGHKF